MMRRRRGTGNERNDGPSATRTEGREARKSEAPRRGFPWITWCLFWTTLYGGTLYSIYWTPKALPVETDLGLFSEDRALKHVHVLSEEIGFRQVSTSGLKQAAEYLEKECHKLAQLARQRSDLDAQVDVEMVSGAIVDHIFGLDLINVYRGLTNVILFVGPKDAMHKPAVLINAHYDSALGSPGAADCGSCVGVGMEVMRTLIESGFQFPCPVLLLLNGGEETLLQAAHGFMQQSAWRDRIGTFLNLESTGSGGAPILFQYTGGWTLHAYAKGVQYPRAIVLAQEFFELGVIPADTDFRMFSRNHHGKYAGVDIATVLDATSYHTNRDSLSRLHTGSTQEFGDAVTLLTKTLTAALEYHVNDTSSEKFVYSTVLPGFLVLYSIETAKWLHLSPFLILLLASLASHNKRLFFSSAVFGVFQNAVSCALGVALPVGFGIARTLLSSQPMVWFSSHFAAFVYFWPAAMIGFLLPMFRTPNEAEVSGRLTGISFTAGVLATYLTFVGIGSSIIPFSVSGATAVASLMISFSKKLPFQSLLIWLYVPCLFTSSLLIVMIKHVMEKIGMAGGGRSAFAHLVPDAVVGGLNGFFVVTVLQLIAPLLTVHWTRRSKKRVIGGLLLWCLSAGALSSLLFPYSIRHPKRIFLNHLCRQQKDFSCEYVWSVATWDAIQLDTSLPEELRQQSPVPSGPIDWQSLAPFNRIVKAVTFPAPSFEDTGPWGTSHPRLVHLEETVHEQNDTRRLNFELRWEKPGWGAMNITGPVLNWSLSDPSGIQAKENSIRFAQDAVDPVWPFWIEIKDGDQLTIQIGVYYPTHTTTIEHMARQFPEWTSVVGGSSFAYRQSFPL